jgi:hypothetical protein
MLYHQFRPNRHASQAAPSRALRMTKPTFATSETILADPRNRPETRGRYLFNQQAAAKTKPGCPEAQMNHSFHSADRSTHLKIVVVALVAGIVVLGLGMSARTSTEYTETAHVVKAGKAITVTNSDTMMVR